MEKKGENLSVKSGDENDDEPTTYVLAPAPVDNILANVTTTSDPDTNATCIQGLSLPNDGICSDSNAKAMECTAAKSVLTPQISSQRTVIGRSNIGRLVLNSETLRSASEALGYGNPGQLHLTSEALPFGMKITIRSTAGNLPVNSPIQQMGAEVFALQSAVAVPQRKFVVKFNELERSSENSASERESLMVRLQKVTTELEIARGDIDMLKTVNCEIMADWMKDKERKTTEISRLRMLVAERDKEIQQLKSGKKNLDQITAGPSGTQSSPNVIGNELLRPGSASSNSWSSSIGRSLLDVDTDNAPTDIDDVTGLTGLTTPGHDTPNPNMDINLD